MHVLVIPSWYPQFEGDPGGSFFREQAIALARRVEDVGVLFPNQRSLRELWNPNSSEFGIHCVDDAGTHLLQRNGFNVTPRYETGVAFQFVHHGIQLYAKYVEQFGAPDVIHAHSALYGGLLAHEIACKSGIPYIVTEHATGFFKNLLKPKQLLWAGKVFTDSMANIAVSQSLKRLLKDRYGFGKEWKTIPNIVSEGFFVNPIETVEQRLTCCRFIHVALLNPIKRQDLLIEAMAICRNLGRTDLTLTIAGDGTERDRLSRRINDLGIGEQVHLAGMVPRDKLPALMAAHSAFVLSSDYETFGVVVAEALALGLPCVTTHCGGPVDIIGAGDGFIVERGNAQAIAEAMIRVSDQPFDMDERQARRNRCAARFSEDAVCRELIAIYTNAICGLCE
jgi:glycosyltransferase involved in cell wall biosynthesis